MKVNQDFIIVVGGRVAAALIALIAIRASTTFLSPEQYGQLSLLMLVQAFCGMILLNPIGQYINRHTHEWWEDGSFLSRLPLYGYYVLFVSLLGAGTIFLVGYVASIDYVLLSFVALCFMVLLGTWNPMLMITLNLLGFRAASVLYTIITVGIALVSSVSLVMWLPLAVAWFSGQVLGMLAGVVVGFRFLYSKGAKGSYSMALIDKNNILRYCIPLAIATGLMWVQLSGYRLIIESYWGLAQLGFITVGLMLAAQLWGVVESLAMQFLYPYFFKRVSNDLHGNEKEALSDLLNTLGPLYLLLGGITVAVAPALVFLLVDDKFSGALVFVMMGAGIECCRALANVFGNAAQVTKRTRSLALPYAIGATVICLLLFLVGNRDMEVVYVGVVLLVGAVMMLLTMIVMMHREVKFTLDLKRWCASGCVMFILAGASYFLPNLQEWWSITLLLAVVGVVAGATAALLLWKNPALSALLNVQLRGE